MTNLLSKYYYSEFHLFNEHKATFSCLVNSNESYISVKKKATTDHIHQ